MENNHNKKAVILAYFKLFIVTLKVIFIGIPCFLILLMINCVIKIFNPELARKFTDTSGKFLTKIADKFVFTNFKLRDLKKDGYANFSVFTEFCKIILTGKEVVKI